MAIQYSNNPLRWLSALAAALPCFYLGYTLLRVWIDPMTIDDGSWVRFGVGLMILEFLLLHSGGMMTGLMANQEQLAGKLKLLFGLMLFYTLMVVTFAYSLESMALLWIFAAVSASRLFTAFTHANIHNNDSQKRIALGVLLYMLVVVGSIFAPIPELGITANVLDEVYPQRGGGIWEREPERAIAAAATYFLLLGLCELFILGPTANTGENAHAS